MSNIVKARKDLQALIAKLEKKVHPSIIAEANAILALMVREPSIRRAKTKSTPITPAIIKGVKQYYKKNKSASQAEIAQHFNINTGRVSEILNDKWEVKYEPL